MANQNVTVYVSNLPVGAIILWNGSSDNVHQNWAICDGSKGTPDLRDRFIVGAGNTYNENATGGNNEITLTELQMPSHTHKVVDPGHQHGYTNTYGPATGDKVGGVGASGRELNWPTDYGQQTAGQYSNISIKNSGGNEAFDNRPLYYALYYIMKTS